MAKRKKRFSTGQMLILLGLVDLVVTMVTLTPKKAKKRRRTVFIPDVRAFETAKGEAAIRPYLAAVEQASGIVGLADFGRAFAWGRSRFDNKQIDFQDRAEACALYLERRATVFAQNPYAESQWCWGSGGWYDFIPADVLALPPFSELDPKLVFDPSASTAMLAGLVHLVLEEISSLAPEERTWLTVRRALENADATDDHAESRPESRAIREQFRAELEATGVTPSFADQTPVRARPYPGTYAIWSELRTIQTPR